MSVILPVKASEPCTFYSDGSYCTEPEKASRKLSEFAALLIKRRRQTHASPAELAGIMAVSEHSKSFNPAILEQWMTLLEHSDWPSAWCARSIERAIKDAGNGMNGCDAMHKLRHPATDFDVAEAAERFRQITAGIVSRFRRNP